MAGSELLQLQSELARLSDPACPVQVADYLSLRCHVTYLQHDVTVRHNLRKALLTTDNLYATKVIYITYNTNITCNTNTPILPAIPTLPTIPNITNITYNTNITNITCNTKYYQHYL